VLRELGADVISLNVNPDGRNINRRCGSVHPEGMCKAVLRHRADIGMSLDGDADRVLLADEKGRLTDGDHILAICALDAADGGRLAGNGVVGTVMSNFGLEVALEKAGIRLVRAAVGDRYVVEEMVRTGYRLGGEQSGHILFLDHQTTGDGIISALQVLSVMTRTGRELSRLASSLKPYPQVLLNVPVGRKVPFEEVPDLSEAVSRAEKKLRGRGRVLVRYSGTEAKLRVMVEGKSQREIEKVASTVADVASASLAEPERLKK
jgi:phosphoglucosamine mutase